MVTLASLLLDVQSPAKVITTGMLRAAQLWRKDGKAGWTAVVDRPGLCLRVAVVGKLASLFKWSRLEVEATEIDDFNPSVPTDVPQVSPHAQHGQLLTCPGNSALQFDQFKPGTSLI